MVCGKCNLDFVSAKDAAKCMECGVQFHAACCRIRTQAKLSRMVSSNAAATWVCDDCRQETASVHGRSDNDDPTVLEVLKKMQHDMASMAKHSKSIEENVSALRMSMSSVETSLDNVKQQLSSVQKENVELRERCDILMEKNIDLGRQVFKLQSEVGDIQQYMRNRNIEVRGIPRTINEDVYDILESVAGALSVNYQRCDISIAHRVPPPRNSNFHPSVIVQFVSRTVRAQWLIAAKKKRLNTKDLAASLPSGPVLILEHLTVQNKELLKYAKSAVASKDLMYAWVREGKIFVRRTDTSRPIRVRSQMDVDGVAGAAGGDASITHSQDDK